MLIGLAWRVVGDDDTGAMELDHGDIGELRTGLVLTHPARGLQPGDIPRSLILGRPALG
ncbi:MAG TPA: hypothetical protein VKA83_21575 [Methylomirabilota bacterium]|nr:hypothetical protein [Methylomirabilota bacterium]